MGPDHDATVAGDLMDTIITLTNLLQETEMALFTDIECVAALNGCIDLAKWNSLPEPIKVRVKDLFKHHRLKMVCFFPEQGFGLRVYNDGEEYNLEWNGDEATAAPKPGQSRARIDLDGCWVRCPKELYNPESKKEWIITDSKAKKFYDYEPDWNGVKSNVVDGPDSDVWNIRAAATKFQDKAQAEKIASKINGIVVEA